MEGGPVAEPTSTKVTLFAALAAIVGPLAAEYSLILAGALVGGFVGLSIRHAPLPGWIRPLGHVLAGVGLSLLVTPMGALVAFGLLPSAWALSVDVLLPVVSLAVAMFWHPAVTRWLPGIVGRWANRDGK
jgi:hypothetical protein